ncbi:MAG: VWA domain-containing protein, partial [Candidatus Acidiferrum sp.]
AHPQPSAGQQKNQPPSATLIRTTTHLVQISVIARDKKGEPVGDLTAADFVVLDNGHPEKIQIFQKETNQPPAKPAPPLPPDTYTNQIRGGVPPSVTMVLLDGLNTEITDQSFARQQTIKFLQQIQPQDRLAIYTLGRDLHVLHGFTSDSSKLVAALGKYSGQTTADLEASAPTSIQTGDDTMDALLQDAFQREANMYIQDRVQITVAALIDIANYAAAWPGRKNLLWVSGSFPFSVGYENLESIVQMMNDPKREANISGEQLMFAEDIEKAAHALNEANVAVYPVDARGLLGLNMDAPKVSNKSPGYGAMNSGQASGGSFGGNPGGNGGRGGGRSGGKLPGGPKLREPKQNSSSAQGPTNPIQDLDKTTFETMDALAEGTGGKAFYNSNDLSSSLRSAIDDSRLTYELGYYPSDVKWDGSFHTVTVELKKPDLVVRARKGYFALPEPALSPDALRDIVTHAAISPLESTGLGLAVRVKATPHDNGIAVSAMIFFDPRSIQFEFKDGRFAGTANMVVAQLDDKNQVLNAAQQSFPLNLSGSQYEQFLKQQAELTQEMNIVPKAAQLRVVLCDGKTGKVGAVGVPLSNYMLSKTAAE